MFNSSIRFPKKHHHMASFGPLDSYQLAVRPASDHSSVSKNAKKKHAPKPVCNFRCQSPNDLVSQKPTLKPAFKPGLFARFCIFFENKMAAKHEVGRVKPYVKPNVTAIIASHVWFHLPCFPCTAPNVYVPRTGGCTLFQTKHESTYAT